MIPLTICLVYNCGVNIFLRRNAHLLLKHATEMTLIAKAQCSSNINHFHSVRQQFLCLSDSALQLELVGSQAILFRKFPNHMEFTES